MVSPLLKARNYNILDFIGKGAFGIVSKIESKEDGKVYALKEISFKSFSGNEKKEKLEECLNEYKLLKKGFKNVVRAIGSAYDDKKDSFYFSMEYFPENLQDFIQNASRNKDPISFEKYLPIFKDVLSGLKNLFLEGRTIHRDLKPENILMDESGKATIADVGVAKTFENKTLSLSVALRDVTSVAGTDVWMPPEIIKLKENFLKNGAWDNSLIDQSKLDIFSLGLISLYALDTSEFTSHKGLNKNEDELNKYLTSFRKRVRIPPSFYYILRCMLSFNNLTRPCLEELHQDINLIYSDPVEPPLEQLKPNHENSGELVDSNQSTVPEYLSKYKIISEQKLKDWLSDPKVAKVTKKLNYKNSTKCEIDFRYNSNVDDDAAIYMAKEISTMTQLKLLNLDLSSTCVVEKGILALGDSFKSLKHLETLQFGLVRISPEAVTALTPNIQNLIGLKELKFSFGENNKVNDASITNLAGGLKFLKNLQLETKVTDQGLESLGNTVSNLLVLADLRLNGSGNKGITDNFLNLLPQKLSSAKALKNISLSLMETKVTRAAGNKFYYGLKGVKCELYI